ncbi:hypothetical protein KFU94_24205 [Chloroflexi bacterium TSY]|nr:hypothetical protein [Chloroflexi bacterium TSY]
MLDEEKVNNLFVYSPGVGQTGYISPTLQNVGGNGGIKIGRKVTQASEYFQGDIAEIIVYSRSLDDAERDSVEDYLSLKYNIALNCKWFGVVSVDWFDTGNWIDCRGSNGDKAPFAADHVVIGHPHQPRNPVLTGNTSVASLFINFDSLTITDSVTLTVNGPFTMNRHLMGNGDLVANGLFTWIKGDMSGTGKVIANKDLNIQGDDAKNFRGRTIENSQTATWSGLGELKFGDGALFKNMTNATFDIQTDSDITAWEPPPFLIENAGTITKTAGSGTTEITVTVDNTGTIGASSGEICIQNQAGGWDCYGNINAASLPQTSPNTKLILHTFIPLMQH